MNPPDIVLASGSRHRADLLRRLRLPFRSHSPDIDESPHPGEPPDALARRLSEAKAHAVARALPGHLVIGSDQVAACEGRLVGKPGDRDTALAQLSASSGRAVSFHTGLCVLAPDGSAHHHLDLTRVRFRTLDGASIERYLDAEDVLDCAGSFRVEGLGISLFEAVETSDPTALVGLPMIALAGILRGLGLTLP